MGKSCDIFSLFEEMKSFTAAVPFGVLMFIYIDFASAEKRSASFGNWIGLE
jgi:hypothetical protein